MDDRPGEVQVEKPELPLRRLEGPRPRGPRPRRRASALFGLRHWRQEPASLRKTAPWRRTHRSFIWRLTRLTPDALRRSLLTTTTAFRGPPPGTIQRTAARGLAEPSRFVGPSGSAGGPA